MTEGERRLCDFVYGLSGSFYRHLFEAIFRADGANLALLETAFPEEITAYKRYGREEGYWTALKKEYGHWGETDDAE